MVWLVKKIIQRRKHFDVEEEVKDEFTKAKEVSVVGFFDQFVESDMKLAEKLVVVAEMTKLTEEVPNLVETGNDISFHN